MKNNKVRKTLILAVFTAAALIIFLVEAQIPVIIAVPGIKLGLSNIIVLITLYFYGRKEAAAVLALKIILGSVFSGQLMSFLYSAAGGLLCLVVMALFKKLISEKQMWAISAFGAPAFNAGQLTAAILILNQYSLSGTAGGLISAASYGVFTGICALLVLPRLRMALKTQQEIKLTNVIFNITSPMI
jgi:heptaprenyl diphosphate synthase